MPSNDLNQRYRRLRNQCSNSHRGVGKTTCCGCATGWGHFPGASNERDCGAVDCQCPPRVPGPDGRHWRTAPAAGPERLCRSLTLTGHTGLAPRANAICERLVGTLRREALDRALILGEAHLRSVLAEYQAHYNNARPHRALHQNPPAGPTHAPGPGVNVRVLRQDRLGGLIHEYAQVALGDRVFGTHTVTSPLTLQVRDHEKDFGTLQGHGSRPPRHLTVNIRSLPRSPIPRSLRRSA